MSDYESDFAVHPYTVVERAAEGLSVRTAVVMDGELLFFDASRALREAGRALETNRPPTNQEAIDE